MENKEPFVFCVPTLHRPQMVMDLVESVGRQTIKPREICVACNGDKVSLPESVAGVPVRVVTNGYNMGVSASWNMFGAMYRPMTIIISNDDIILNPDACETALGFPEAFVRGCGYSVFLIRERCWRECGWFDENIWPAFHEDSEYSKRKESVGLSPASCAIAVHRDGETMEKRKASPEYSRKYIDKHLEYLEQRWAIRLGDQVRFGLKPLHDRTGDGAEYEYRCMLKLKEPDSDLAPLLPTLRDFSRHAQHITDIGTGEAVSAFAFLANSPAHLVCMEVSPRPQWERVQHFRGKTHVRLVAADSTQIKPIRETDFLFLDSDHSGATLEKELNLHGNQSRGHIAIHGTFTHKENGVGNAIYDFLSSNKHWKVSHETEESHGLTIMERN